VTLTEQPDRAAQAGPTWPGDVALGVAAFFFGTTFVVVKDAIAEVEPSAFLAVRFLIGAAVLAVAAWGRPASPREVRHGIVAGLALWVGYTAQTVGLQYTDPSTSAFLTYLVVVFVPILGWLFLRQRLHRATGIGIALALVGLALLTGGRPGSGGLVEGIGRGELLTVGCAVAFAAHMLILGRTAWRHDPVRLTCVQIATVGIASLVVSSLGGVDDVSFGGAPLLAAAFTGVFATALAFLLMVWAQRSVTPSRAALILLLEPVFAALLSWLSGESLTLTSAIGGALILLAVAVSELLPNTLTSRSR